MLLGLHNAEPAERERRVNELLDSVGLVDLAARYPIRCPAANNKESL